MELESDLRVASDRMLKTLEQLESLENEKRTLNPSTPRFQKLASEIERLAAVVFAQTHAQQQLGAKAKAVTEQTGVEVAPIAESGQLRDVQVILAEWRDAERRLMNATPDSAEHAQAAADIGRLRDEYHETYTASASDRRD